MTFTADSQIHAIFSGLIDKTLPKTEWTHAAHFAAAFAIIVYPDFDAASDMPEIIRNYNESTGTPNTDSEGYHHTITLASLGAAIYMRNIKGHAAPLFQLTNDLLNSEYGRSDWLFKYWSQSILFSVNARRHWVPPDLKGLPFEV
jgi:hypothetical protein